jgi:hypothetical protein
MNGASSTDNRGEVFSIPPSEATATGPMGGCSHAHPRGRTTYFLISLLHACECPCFLPSVSTAASLHRGAPRDPLLFQCTCRPDAARSVFQLCAIDGRFQLLSLHVLSRHQFVDFADAPVDQRDTLKTKDDGTRRRRAAADIVLRRVAPSAHTKRNGRRQRVTSAVAASSIASAFVASTLQPKYATTYITASW